MRARSPRTVLTCSLLGLLATACGGGGDDHEHAHDHTAPRGGLLVELADHEAHAEFLFEAETGTLTMYLLGGHAQAAMKSAQDSIAVQIDGQGTDGAALELALLPVASDLTGEIAGDTSRFEVADPALVGASEFAGRIGRVELRGATYEDVGFAWPPDADHDDHDDGHDH